ncbi:hypothetical protein FRC00_010133, partial [Tulasnella sp. 408]
MNPFFNPYNTNHFELPTPPKEFGQDGGKFYRCYDALAEEIDEDMVRGLKEQLDGLLIFATDETTCKAGLFAGVNTAFLALTLPLMSPNPADDTNVLLRDNNAILLNIALGRNDSLPSPKALPSETFSPTGRILTVNILFSVSLTFGLISAFLAVVGRSSLVYYRKRTAGGPDRQRWEQLKRSLGAERWQLEWVLDDFLPCLLEFGLIIFGISLTMYFHTLHPTLSNAVGSFLCAGLAILIITAILAALDKFCPFQSPLSHLISWISEIAYKMVVLLVFTLPRLIFKLFQVFLGAFLLFVGTLCGIVRYWFGRRPDVTLPWKGMGGFARKDLLEISFLRFFTSLASSAAKVLKGDKPGDEDAMLQITAIRRVICTSDDAMVHIHCISNIFAITDPAMLNLLLADDLFQTRLWDLCGKSYGRTLQFVGGDREDLARAVAWLYRAAVAHIILCTTDSIYVGDFLEPLTRDESSGILPSSALVRNANSNVINAYLAFVALPGDRLPLEARRSNRSQLHFIMDGLIDPTWRRISIILRVVIVYWDLEPSPLDVLRMAYVGEPHHALESLELVLRRSNDHRCEDRDTLKEYLVHIFKSAGAAVEGSNGGSRSGMDVVASLLRMSEGFLRSENSPEDFTNVGRKLRVELTGVFHLDDTVEELFYLFSDLTADGKQPTASSNEDDLEL